MRVLLLLSLLVASASPAGATVSITFTKVGGNVTFQSHNQKVVSNANGIFLTTGDAGGNVPMALWRSTDGGNTFANIYERILNVNPPTIETDEDNNIYLIYPESADDRTRFQKLTAANGYTSPVISKSYTQASSSGKFASVYDPGRGVFYHATQTGYILTIDKNGTLTRSKQLFATGSTGSRPSYPHLFVDNTGVLHYAVTCADQGDDIPYETIRYLKSTDGGGTWKTMSGASISTPTTSNPNGPSTQINLASENIYSTWLGNMHVKDGKAHFGYRTENVWDPAGAGNPPTITPQMHYMRFEGTTGVREIDNTNWSGGAWEIDSVPMAFSSDPDDPTAPLFAVGGNGEGSERDGNRLVALVSYDNGETWSDHARSGWQSKVYDPGLARAVTADGKVIGSVTLTNPWATTNFFKFDTAYVYFDAGSGDGLQGGSGTAEGTNFSESAGAKIACVGRTQSDSILFKVNSSKTYEYTSGGNQAYGNWVVGNANVVTHKVTAAGKTQTFTGDIIVQGGSSMQWNTANMSISGAPSVIVKEGSTNKFTGTATADTTYSLGSLTLGSGNNRLETVDGSAALDLTFTALSGDSGDVISLGAGGSGKTTLTVNNAAASSFGGTISGTGNLTKKGSGTLTLSGANTYTGSTTVNAGTLRLSGGANRIRAGNAVNVAGGGTFDLNGQNQTLGSLTGGGAVLTGGGVLTVGSDGSSSTFGGVISEAGWLTKTGAGTLTLTGANKYTGSTAVQAGTLLVTGSLAGEVTVAGGTFGGGGTVGNLALTDGTHAPGASVGVDHVKDYSLGQAAMLNIEIDGPAGAGAVGGHDQVDAAGHVSLAGTLALDLADGWRPDPAKDVFVLIANDSTDPVAGTFSGLAEGDAVTLTNDQGTYNFAITYRYDAASSTLGIGNDVALVPEPSALVFAAFELLGLWRWDRRRRRLAA